MKNVESTAKELSASGVVLTVSPWMEGFEFNADSMSFKIPMIIIPYAKDSKYLLDYCNQSHEKSNPEEASGRIVGASAKFSFESPKVASYSSRGPDPANSFYRAADVLKPNIAAPGSSIWAAWTPYGVDALYFEGEKFAMLSGTSMATPHIAGIAALVKQKNPKLSVAGIASTLSTTSSPCDHEDNPILVEDPFNYLSNKSSKHASPFDMGNGMVNASAAINPGLVFNADYEDYVKFLCTIKGAAVKVRRALGKSCKSYGASEPATSLNSPYVAISKLRGKLLVPRVATHMGKLNETYEVSVKAPKFTSVNVSPLSFTLSHNTSQSLEISIEPYNSSASRLTPCFGSILFSGNHGHFARIPIAVVSINQFL